MIGSLPTTGDLAGWADGVIVKIVRTDTVAEVIDAASHRVPGVDLPVVVGESAGGDVGAVRRKGQQARPCRHIRELPRQGETARRRWQVEQGNFPRLGGC